MSKSRKETVCTVNNIIDLSDEEKALTHKALLFYRHEGRVTSEEAEKLQDLLTTFET